MNHRPRILFLCMLAACTLAYSNHFHNSFHFDDSHTVVDNPAIRDLRNLPKFFSDANTFSVLPSNRTWRPLVTTSLAIDYYLAQGYNVVWFHISTWLWFLVQLGATYALFNTIAASVRPGLQWTSLFATAWYGLHPAIAETVNYVIQRGEVFSTLGVIAGLVVYARFPKLRRTGLYLIPAAAAILGKPPALVFPVLLGFYIFLFESDSRHKHPWSALRGVIPALLVFAAMAWLQKAMTPVSYLPGIISAHDYRITQPFVWMRYFGAFFLPVHLSADSDLAPFASLNTEAVAGFAFVGALLWACWFTAVRPSLRPISFGLVWFAVALLPTSLYPLSEVENDHRMFFAFAGLTLAATWAAAIGVEFLKAKNEGLPKVVGALAAALLCAYAYGTWQRNKVWLTEESLWRDVTVKSPSNGRGLMNYGLTQMQKGDYASALSYFTNAAQFTPNYSVLEINLGVVNGALHKDAESETHFKRALELAPLDAQPHYYYGRWLAEVGRTAEARQHLTTSVSLNPVWSEPRDLLYRIAMAPLRESNVTANERPAPEDFLTASLRYHQSGMYEQSIAAARNALRLRPGYAEAYNNIAAANEALGRWDEAIAAATEAIRLKPDFQLAKNNLAWAKEQKRKAAAR